MALYGILCAVLHCMEVRSRCSHFRLHCEEYWAPLRSRLIGRVSVGGIEVGKLNVCIVAHICTHAHTCNQDAAIIDHGANSAAYYINELSGGVVSWSTRHAIAGTISGPFNIRLFDLDNDGDLDSESFL